MAHMRCNPLISRDGLPRGVSPRAPARIIHLFHNKVVNQRRSTGGFVGGHSTIRHRVRLLCERKHRIRLQERRIPRAVAVIAPCNCAEMNVALAT